jgi:tetratricopeptide (TPR) repeat protein
VLPWLVRDFAARLGRVRPLPDPDTLAQLALQDMQNNEADAAQAKCLQALNANRQHPLALTVLGLILHSRARHEDAVRVFNALTLLEPNNAEHWTNLGTALRPTRRYDQALAAHNRAMALGPVSAGLLYNIGLLHMDRFEYDPAYAILTQALNLAPTAAGVRWLFAQCCYDIGLVEEALAALEGWQKFQGLNPEVSAQIAYLLVSMGESRRAEPALRQLSADPRDAGRNSLVAVRVLERLNRLADARTALESIKTVPGTNVSDPDLLMAEAMVAQREGDDEAACRCLALALQDQSDPLRRHHLLFPLAKSLDTLGRCEEAYAALEEAHRSQVAFLQAIIGKTPADGSPTMALVDNGCDPDDVAAWQEASAPAPHDTPIFIVGFPRSGTTLLEQTLDAHPLLKSMDEQPFLQKARDDVADCGIRYPVELGKLSSDELRGIRSRYWERVRNKIELRPEQRLVDKNPLNMLRLPLIRRLFPDARIILAIRHPCDTILSCFMQYFRAPDLALMCRDLPTLADNYKHAFDFWYAQWPILRPFSCEIQYETFVADFRAQVRNLSDFLQLPWDDAMLAPGEHARAKGFISTPSYSQVIEPISSRSVGHWKAYERHFNDVLPTLLPYLERWGYAT